MPEQQMIAHVLKPGAKFHTTENGLAVIKRAGETVMFTPSQARNFANIAEPLEAVRARRASEEAAHAALQQANERQAEAAKLAAEKKALEDGKKEVDEAAKKAASDAAQTSGGTNKNTTAKK